MRHSFPLERPIWNEIPSRDHTNNRGAEEERKKKNTLLKKLRTQEKWKSRVRVWMNVQNDIHAASNLTKEQRRKAEEEEKKKKKKTTKPDKRLLNVSALEKQRTLISP